jgi:ATP-binding protein involved in chromosome partitioning
VSADSIPQRIHRGEREIVITWDETHVGTFSARELRLQCQCALCRDELTGRPLLVPAAVPEDVHAIAIGLVGSYAVRVDWSDGHDSGIYPYDFLRSLCPCQACTSVRRHASEDGG